MFDNIAYWLEWKQIVMKLCEGWLLFNAATPEGHETPMDTDADEKKGEKKDQDVSHHSL